MTAMRNKCAGEGETPIDRSDGAGGSGKAAAALYLDLLKRCLTNTLFQPEPDSDRGDDPRFVFEFMQHYLRGPAVTMLPRRRLDHLEKCIVEVLSRGIAGDFIETGVWRGGAAIFMRAMLKVQDVRDRAVWAADSFQGLPEPDPEKFPREAKVHSGAVMTKSYKHFAAGLEEVKQNFAAYGLLDEQVKFLPGWFRDTLPAAPVVKLAIMRLDGDYYESTRDALVHLYDKLSPGGFVVVDDYGEDLWTYCRHAVDEFRRERNVLAPMSRVDSKCFFWQKPV